MKTHSMNILMGAVAASLALLAAAPAAQAGTEPYLGEIMVTIDDICPKGWQRTNGQVMQVKTNNALYSLLGTRFGGDGNTTFKLPDLRGRTVVGAGASMTADHPLGGALASGATGGVESTFLMPVRTALDSGAAKTAAAGTIAGAAPAGAGPVATLPPWIGLTTCIATTGFFPTRP
jgi:microcystin-dependent protein